MGGEVISVVYRLRCTAFCVTHSFSRAHTHGRRSNVNTQKTAVLTTGTILNYMHRDYPKGYLQQERKENATKHRSLHNLRPI